MGEVGKGGRSKDQRRAFPAFLDCQQLSPATASSFVFPSLIPGRACRRYHPDCSISRVLRGGRRWSASLTLTGQR